MRFLISEEPIVSGHWDTAALETVDVKTKYYFFLYLKETILEVSSIGMFINHFPLFQTFLSCFHFDHTCSFSYVNLAYLRGSHEDFMSSRVHT